MRVFTYINVNMCWRYSTVKFYAVYLISDCDRK